ncbi:homocysteine S-methyltransferase family protein [candidate division KSB1 bacterium]|nr:homocysteine S-methyltransferase family protein [candidate division KSB1 bacterium]
MKSILPVINEGKVLLSDGAWGTFLHRKGLQAGECPELWNVENQDAVLEIAQSYIDSGSDLIETNSFGGNPLKLAHYGLKDRAAELNEAAAAISRKAAGPDHWVLGSIGPTGQILMMGDVSEDEMLKGFRIQAAALEKGSADAICIETMTALDEATLAVKAAKESTQIEVICTLTFDLTQTGEFRTMMGHSSEEVVIALKEVGADIIGTNCGNGFSNMIGIVKEIRTVDAEIPIMVQANAGAPIIVDSETVFPETPEQMAALVPELVAAGANIIGGCCGTTPDHIRAIRNVLG